MTQAPPPGRLRRVLALLPSAALGGAEAMTAVLLRDLHAQGVALDIAVEPALRDGFAAMLGPGLEDAVSAAPIGWPEDTPRGEADAPPSENVPRILRRQAAVTAARLLTVRPDLVLLPLPWPSHGAGVMTALPSTPVLVIAHLAPREADPAMEAALRDVPAAVLGWPGVTWAAVAAPTAARVEALLGLAPGRVAVVPNGVPVPRLTTDARRAARQAKRASLGLAEAAALLVVAGRLEPKKGSDLLPGLARALVRRVPGATLAVLGDGPARPRIAAEAEALGLGGALRLLGRVPDVGDWLLAADALLLPSRLEGCPLVFLEAAARRCPVVATEAALEAFGAAAPEIAALAPDDMVSALADQAASVLTAAEADRRLRVEAAWRLALAWDETAMLARYRTLLRVAAAAA